MHLRVHWRIWLAISVPFLLLVVGATCYRLIEGAEWTWNDAFYMSAITLTTVGYGETRPLSPEGRWFTIGFLFTGVFTLFFTATEIIRAIISGQMRHFLGRERMEYTLSQMVDHVIVCGFGRMGRNVCHEFERQKVPFVIVDREVSLFAEWNFHHGIPLHGDATQDETLLHAGVHRARALVAALPSDADNLYIVLSSRVLNEKLAIVARAEEEAAIAKLRRVGANHVVSPHVIGGHRASQAVLRPTVGHLLEMAGRHDFDYSVEEFIVEAGSQLCGKTLQDSRLHEDYGIIVLTRRGLTEQDVVYNPRADTILHAGCTLVVVGFRQQIKQARKLGRAEER